MGDILSQNEIDELLKALNTGELDVREIQSSNREKRIKEHDFRRPSKFSKDHIKTLHIIHENYARLVTNFLTGYLRTLVQVDLITVEELHYGDFSNSVSNPAILGIMDFSPLNGSIIFEMAPNIAFALVDRILGGKGLNMDRIREFTEIEIAIIERILIQTINLIKEPWQNVTQIKPRLERIETNAQFAQIVSENEMVALITLGARVGEVEGMMNICIPHMVVEPLVSKLSTRYWFTLSEKGKTQVSSGHIESRIGSTTVPVKALLGRTTITVGEFMELDAGDVLPTSTNIHDDLEILVGKIPKFLGKPGVRKNRVAIKITDIIKQEEGL